MHRQLHGPYITQAAIEVMKTSVKAMAVAGAEAATGKGSTVVSVGSKLSGPQTAIN